ncbi:MAG TPA: NAD-dependent epimerase/dehydratase family protein [Nannocystaceae bacterium]|nr:NAD-dependent epimerase/dehydratase family protein [Nannocystaceae bacterium]
MQLATRRNRPTRVATEATGKRYLVVGGHGLLGSHLVEGLLARGEAKVRVLDVAPSTLFDEEVARGHVEVQVGDVRDRDAVRQACRGVDVVFHTAAAVNYWANLPFEYDAIHDINVRGTQNVVEACIAENVTQLVHTSSCSVVVNRDLLRSPMVLADESSPYAREPFLCHYVQTKIIAEQTVLAANGRGRLLTAALRPGGLYGPRDRFIAAASQAGKPGIGGAANVIEHIYVENVVHAFFLLERSLVPDAPVCGRAYFVTNYAVDERTESYVDFNRRMSRAFGRTFKRAPSWAISALAWTSHAAMWLTKGAAERFLGELKMLRPATLALTRGTFYFSGERARVDFGYTPLYGVDEALALTAAWFDDASAR